MRNVLRSMSWHTQRFSELCCCIALHSTPRTFLENCTTCFVFWFFVLDLTTRGRGHSNSLSNGILFVALFGQAARAVNDANTE